MGIEASTGSPMQLFRNVQSKCNGGYDHSKDAESEKDIKIKKKIRGSVTFEHTLRLLKKKNVKSSEEEAAGRENEFVCKENKENVNVKTEDSVDPVEKLESSRSCGREILCGMETNEKHWKNEKNGKFVRQEFASAVRDSDASQRNSVA